MTAKDLTSILEIGVENGRRKEMPMIWVPKLPVTTEDVKEINESLENAGLDARLKKWLTDNGVENIRQAMDVKLDVASTWKGFSVDKMIRLQKTLNEFQDVISI